MGRWKRFEALPFPGNVRELENILERALTLCDGQEITAEDWQLPATDSSAGVFAAFSGEESLDDYIERGGAGGHREGAGAGQPEQDRRRFVARHQPFRLALQTGKTRHRIITACRVFHPFFPMSRQLLWVNV